MGEHLPCTQGVRSSNLLISTTSGEALLQRREGKPKRRESSEAREGDGREPEGRRNGEELQRKRRLNRDRAEDERPAARKHGLIAQAVRARA